MKLKRLYCICPYCNFLSLKFVKVKLHVEYVHPYDEPVVLEKMGQPIPDEVENVQS